MGIPAVSFVGHSESGKTTLIEKLIPVLKGRGYRVATIKHAEEIDLGYDKDSARHLQAGSESTAVVTPERIVLISPTPQPAGVHEVIRLLDNGFDIILCEGYKHADLPKIEVRFRSDKPRLEGITNLVAVVTDKPLDSTAKQFSFNDIEALVDFLEKDFIQPQAESLDLYVNTVPIPLSVFPTQIISAAVASMASCLKGVNRIRHLEIKLRKPVPEP